MDTSRPKGQLLAGRSGYTWLFDSGSIALDFAYTGPMPDDPAREMLPTPIALDDWLDRHFPEVDAAASTRDLTDALTLRAAIARAAVAISRGDRPLAEDVDILNLFAATPDIPPALPGGHRHAGSTRARPAQALSEMAREVTRLYAPDLAERIRACSADDCALVFYDDSRSNSRRWCSMQRCGNRAKVRAHRARTH